MGKAGRRQPYDFGRAVTSANLAAANALIDALSALAMARDAVNAALLAVGADAPEPPTRQGAVVRTTSTQIMSVLAASSDPLTLIDIADGVCALRRGEDEPKKGGGTRYQEMCRTSLSRLIDRGLVARVPPASKTDLMRFKRSGS